MTITASEIIEDRPQIDARRHVRERHTDHLAAVHHVAYVADASTDANALLLTHANAIDQQLPVSEHQRNFGAVNGEEAPVFAYTTRAQFLFRVRIVYASAVALQAVRIGKFVHGLGLTDDQLKTLFGVDDIGLLGLKLRLQRQSDLVASIRAETGQ